jgi:hypothetical protein
MILRLTADCRIIRRFAPNRSRIEQIRFAQFFFHYARGTRESKPGNSGFFLAARDGVRTESRSTCGIAHPEAYFLSLDSGEERRVNRCRPGGVFSG